MYRSNLTKKLFQVTEYRNNVYKEVFENNLSKTESLQKQGIVISCDALIEKLSVSLQARKADLKCVITKYL